MKFSDVPDTSIPLAALRRGEHAVVTALVSSGEADASTDAEATLLDRLRDLGFVAGARCQILARMWLGGDPMVVRIGGSTFALRKAEAASIRVLRQQEQRIPGRVPGPGNASPAAV